MLLSTAVNERSAALNLELGRRHPETIRAFVGVHPSEAGGGLDWMEGAVVEASGVGETGLDPNYSDVSEKSDQMVSFLAHLRLAEEKRKPIQLHTRGAERVAAEKLSSYHLPSVLLHWFEDEESSSLMADRGYYVSLGPAVLYSKKLSRIAASYPADLILPETDGPVAFKALGGVAGPFLVPSVVLRLAELRRKGFAEMAELLLKNGLSYLGEERKVNHHSKLGLK